MRLDARGERLTCYRVESRRHAGRASAPAGEPGCVQQRGARGMSRRGFRCREGDGRVGLRPGAHTCGHRETGVQERGAHGGPVRIGVKFGRPPFAARGEPGKELRRPQLRVDLR